MVQVATNLATILIQSVFVVVFVVVKSTMTVSHVMMDGIASQASFCQHTHAERGGEGRRGREKERKRKRERKETNGKTKRDTQTQVGRERETHTHKYSHTNRPLAEEI
jgi:hypothetical protein